MKCLLAYLKGMHSCLYLAWIIQAAKQIQTWDDGQRARMVAGLGTERWHHHHPLPHFFMYGTE